MADIEEAIVSRVTATTTALGSRVYPVAVVDSSTPTPFLTYEKVNGEHEQTLVGECGVAHAEFNLNIVTSATPGSSGYKDVKAIKNTLRLNLDGKSGTWGSVKVRRSVLTDDFDNPTISVGVEQQKRDAIGLILDVFYFESTT